jgi:hypothetical protein
MYCPCHVMHETPTPSPARGTDSCHRFVASPCWRPSHIWPFFVGERSVAVVGENSEDVVYRHLNWLSQLISDNILNLVSSLVPDIKFKKRRKQSLGHHRSSICSIIGHVTVLLSCFLNQWGPHVSNKRYW